MTTIFPRRKGEGIPRVSLARSAEHPAQATWSFLALTWDYNSRPRLPRKHPSSVRPQRTPTFDRLTKEIRFIIPRSSRASIRRTLHIDQTPGWLGTKLCTYCWNKSSRRNAKLLHPPTLVPRQQFSPRFTIIAVRFFNGKCDEPKVMSGSKFACDFSHDGLEEILIPPR